MNIIVCIKQVPAKDAPLAIAGNWIKESDIGFEMNEPDSYALEEALRLKEKHGGEVIALSFGPERVKQTIKEALAKGADRGIHISDDNFAQLDPLGSARVLAAAISKEKCDLVLTGLQSDDYGFGQTGPPNVMNPFDAVPAAARLLCADGAAAGGQSLYNAIFDYNHADWYVREVLSLAAEYAANYP